MAALRDVWLLNDRQMAAEEERASGTQGLGKAGGQLRAGLAFQAPAWKKWFTRLQNSKVHSQADCAWLVPVGLRAEVGGCPLVPRVGDARSREHSCLWE